MAQRRVKVAEMKAHFSAYLKRASNGERITVLDRDRPVAELGPLPAEADDIEAKLVERLGARLGAQDFSKLEFPKMKSAINAQALLEAIREE